MSWPYDFDTRGIRALPHRLRLRKLLARMRQYDFSGGSYADVGCGDGYVTAQVMRVTGAQRCDGLDYDPALLESGGKTFREISFVPCNLNCTLNGSNRYDFVTCFETLEHVVDLPMALRNLLHLTKPGGRLILTVPIEVGFVGTAKFLAKTVLWRDRLTEAFPLRPGMHRDYLKALLSGEGISRFRRDGNALGYWPGHWGFDYRELDHLFNEHGMQFTSDSFLTTRYFEVRP